jgi:hypothetical protein
MMKKRYVLLFITVMFLLLGVAWGKNNAAEQPTHAKYMKGQYADGISVTKDCLKCHRQESEDILESAHWLWKGPTPLIEGHEDRTDLGKKNIINNF